MNSASPLGLPSVLGVIAAMITPAILILRAEIVHALGEGRHELDAEGPNETVAAAKALG